MRRTPEPGSAARVIARRPTRTLSPASHADEASLLVLFERMTKALGPNWISDLTTPPPRTRDACPRRPCLRLCRFSLVVSWTEHGSLRLAHPDVPLSRYESQGLYTCVLDFIDANPRGATVEDVAYQLGICPAVAHDVYRHAIEAARGVSRA